MKVNEVVDLIAGTRIEQDRKISNEMLQHLSPERLKIELSKQKRESLAILSGQLVPRVTELETPNPMVHTITYSGYFINEAEFEKIKELLGWKTKPEKAQTDQETTDKPKQPSTEQPQQSEDQSSSLV